MKKIPLKDRLAAAKPKAGGGCPVVGATLCCVFQGAYMNCGRRYLSWLLKTVRELYNAPDAIRYEEMVFHAAERLMADENYREEGYELLYETLIEPFCLMAERLEKQDQKDN